MKKLWSQIKSNAFDVISTPVDVVLDSLFEALDNEDCRIKNKRVVKAIKDFATVVGLSVIITCLPVTTIYATAKVCYTSFKTWLKTRKEKKA